MKICLVTERKNIFGIQPEGQLDTNDVNIAALLGADRHYCMEEDVQTFAPYDMVMLKMSKVKEPYDTTWMGFIHRFKDKWPSKILVMYQEAEVDWPLRRPIEDQVDLYRGLKRLDAFMAHNASDVGFYRSLFGTRTFHVPTPLPLDIIASHRKPVEERWHRYELVFGSSFDNRGYGVFGLAAAKVLKSHHPRLRLTQYTRSKYEDDRNDRIRAGLEIDFETIPQLGWLEYIERLSNAYLTMNLMPAAAAGRDAITSAALGIPHVGNYLLDPARECFPGLAVNPVDLNAALSSCCYVLDKDIDQYKHICDVAMTRVEAIFSFKAVKAYLKQQFKDVLGVDL